MARIAKRSIDVELRFYGQDRIVEQPKGVFRGGVPDPEVTSELGFNVLRQESDEDGNLHPAPGDPVFDGSLQINIWGDTKSFRELGRYLLAIAELDTEADPGFHQHHELRSTDGRSHLNLIVRKPHA